MRGNTRTLAMPGAAVAVAVVMLAAGCGGSSSAASKDDGTPSPTTTQPQTTTGSTTDSTTGQSPTSKHKSKKSDEGAADPTKQSPSSPSGTTHQKNKKSGDKPSKHKKPHRTKHPMEPPAHPKNQSVVLNRLPGSAKATCTPVGDRRDVRSGSVAAGNFVQARGAYKKAAAHREVPTVFMYVIPQHNKGLEHATVTMKPVDADGEARTVRSNDVEQANVWKYFAFQLPVPAAGTWQLHMSSGDDRGCFEVNFTKQ